MLPDVLQRKSPKDWTFNDLQSVIGCEESIGLEIKSDLPLKKDASGWRKSKKLHSSEKEGLAKEIVAFANSYGGNLLIGFEESFDHPKRAVKLSVKINDVDDLVDQLKRSFSASIEPPLMGLEIISIKENPNDPNGYVLIHVPDSLSKPHGLRSPPPSYIRRDDRSEPMGIRDMQDRFLEAQTSRQRIDNEIFEFSLSEVLPNIVQNSVQASFTLIPSSPVDTQNLLAEIQSQEFRQLQPLSASSTTASLLYTPTSNDWRPYAFGIRTHRQRDLENNSSLANWTIKDNGTINAHGYRMGTPTKQYSTDIYDMEVFPFWLSVVARDLLSIQTGLMKKMKWPTIDWFFVCEIRTAHEQTFVRTDKDFEDHEKIDFIKPISLKPIRLQNAYDSEGVNIIETKINHLFGLQDSLYGTIISYKSESNHHAEN